MARTQFQGSGFTFKSEALWIVILNAGPFALGLMTAILLWLIERIIPF
jgi:hypothetical protein